MAHRSLTVVALSAAARADGPGALGSVPGACPVSSE